MINLFKNLGECVLRKAGYYDIENNTEKRKIFLNFQSIVPMPRKKKDGTDDEITNAISLDFNTKENIFKFILDKELSIENREYFFAFSTDANNRKKFLSTNNMPCFYSKFITDSIAYIEDKRKQKKSKQWFLENISQDYDELLKEIKEAFYLEIGQKKKKAYILNKDCIDPDKKDSLIEIEKKLLEKQKDKTKQIPVEGLYNSLINKEFYNKDSKESKEFTPVILSKIDGKHILEYETYRNSYINLVYYDLFERFFIEKGKADKICHTCGEKSNVVGDVSLLMKFYGTTNNLFFENLKKTETYKSFSVCKPCLMKIFTGMKFTETDFNDYLLGNVCYLIPETDKGEPAFDKKYKKIFKLLRSNEGYMNNITVIDGLLQQANRKNFRFNLLFFDIPRMSKAFNIVKYISNIDYQNLSEKLKLFDKYNKDYDLSLFGNNNSIKLYDIRNYFFPTKSSHNKADSSLFRKDILDLLEAFLHGNSMNYNVLIKRFMNIYRLKFNRNAIDELSPFKMILMLSIFNKIKPLKGVEIMETGSCVTQIQQEEYQKFFTEHHVVYENNSHRQGLFLLGTIINRIVHEQRKKSLTKSKDSSENKKIKASSTFLKKINYSGIPARRINKLVAEVQNYTLIYDIYEETGIWGTMMDRLQGIEKSTMKGEEIVFYILTGISFKKYLELTKNLEK
jgi:CRISPR-associated protein Csh1